MTKEQEKISRRNRRKARVYFGISGDRKLVLHHINPEWKHTDIERYIQWNPEDLQVMTISEHTSFHKKGVQHDYYAFLGKHHSEDTKQRISESRKGIKFSEEHKEILRQKKLGENNPFYGTHYYNNGIIEVRAKECPDGYIKGRLKK